MKLFRFAPSLIYISLTFLSALAASAQTFTQSTLYSFGNFAGGGFPLASLTQASDGDFYGTVGSPSIATIFKLTPDGAYTPLNVSLGTSDYLPGVLQGSDGNFYGVTSGGPTSGPTLAPGIVFEFTRSGQLITLYTFTGGSDGSTPLGGLVEGKDGSLYGSTAYAGKITSPCPSDGCGTIFKISTSGTFSTLYTFTGGDDEGRPGGTLLQGSDGNFYGVAGGDLADGIGNGTVFKITPAGVLTTLYKFSGNADGAGPSSGLVEGSDGNFYGTTSTGATNESGTIFKITPAGTLTTLHSFCSSADCADGSDTLASLFLASDGNFYGTGYEGGNTSLCNLEGCGTLFQLTPSGAFSLLYTFAGGDDGGWPYGSLLQANDGNFYGAAEIGGTNNIGAIYKLTASPALAAPVQLSPGSASVNALSPATYSWQSLNSFSDTLQQCYAFSTNAAGLLTPLGKQSGTLSAGIYSGSFTYTPTSAGAYTVAVTCGGQETATSTLNVAALPTTTSLSVPGPITAGEEASITATIAAGDSGPVNSGSVTLVCGTLTIGTASVSAGMANIASNTATYAAGTYPCKATYTDAGGTYVSSSASTPVTINPQLSEIALTSSPTSPAVGDTVALTAAVDGQYAVPTGTVVFKIGSYVLGSAKLNPSSGIATIQVNTAHDHPGPYSVTATFQGDFNTKASSTTLGITLGSAPQQLPRAPAR
jgi:uncharacterized repeat protein (TIGR03803 family)